ncbi:glycosyltransferase family 4 protein [Nitrospira sp. MA-1]|nr:glycosyltransferase family 4 protein [Nitrospira sp. MA-1]
MEAGIEIDVFPIYPLDPLLWKFVPDILGEEFLPRNRIHHLNLPYDLRLTIFTSFLKFRTFLNDTFRITASGLKFGVTPVSKSAYVFLKALAWVHQRSDEYDHVLGYWGNYAATCAYVFHRLMNRRVPFSIFLHAGTDLYRTPVFMRQKLLYAANIITCTEFNRKFLNDHYSDIFSLISEKIFVHLHGLDLKALTFDPTNRPKSKILAVGNFAKNKGFDFLLRAACELKHEGIVAELELVGDGAEMENLKLLAKELGISEQVSFSGWIKPDDVQNAMRKATILVHPSTGLGDGVPNVIKEAMAVGTPVIASSVAGIPGMLDNGRCGILVPPQNVAELAKAIKSLLADQSLRLQFADAARGHTEKHFDLWKNGQRLADRLLSTT